VALRPVLELLNDQWDTRLTALALRVGGLLKGGSIRGANKLISHCLQRFISEFFEQRRPGRAIGNLCHFFLAMPPACRPARTRPRLCACRGTLSSSGFLRVSATTQVASGIDSASLDHYILRRRDAVVSRKAEEKSR
jgi:hypothetical protein